MIWQHHAKLHWKCDDIKPYVCEVKVVIGKGFTVWRIQKDGVTIAKGREQAPLDAMNKATDIVIAKRDGEERTKSQIIKDMHPDVVDMPLEEVDKDDFIGPVSMINQ